MNLVEENRIREIREGRTQERGTVTVVAFANGSSLDTLIYLPRYKANPRKRIRENDLGLLSETMRVDPGTSRGEAPLQAALRGYREEMADDFGDKELFVQTGRVYSTMLFDTRKGWDTDVSHVQGYLTVFWVRDRSQFPLAVDTEEMNGAEWISVREILDKGSQLGFRQSPPSPLAVIGKLHSEGFFNSDHVSFRPVLWHRKI